MMRLHSDWLHEAVKNTACGENLREEYQDIDFDIISELACDELDDER